MQRTWAPLTTRVVGLLRRAVVTVNVMGAPVLSTLVPMGSNCSRLLLVPNTAKRARLGMEGLLQAYVTSSEGSSSTSCRPKGCEADMVAGHWLATRQARLRGTPVMHGDMHTRLAGGGHSRHTARCLLAW